jgi:hypothetical protein
LEVEMKTIAMVFGVLMLGVGILGYVPALTPEGRLFGIFAVDGLHNMVHVVTGVAAIAAAMASAGAARTFFKIFGVVYALVAVLGIFHGNDPLLGVMAHNVADVFLHVAIAAFALYMGFMYHGAADTGRHGGLRGA